MTNEDKIRRLEAFKELLAQWQANPTPNTRSSVNQDMPWVRQEVLEAGCLMRATIAPPPVIGGLIMRNVDVFGLIFDPPWGLDLVAKVNDMVDKTIGVLRNANTTSTSAEEVPTITSEVVENYAFIAMPMDKADVQLEDVLDAIKEAAKCCGIEAERVDEPSSNERITDRILESIRKAEFVIADLTSARPNVYYEAGFAHALGKIPIYIARQGTHLEFDLRDYPVIFFANLKQLKEQLERRLRGIARRGAS
jgi:hypothetical protein